MKVVVVGYGRVGRRTVAQLVERGHEVTLIDKEAARLRRAVDVPDVKLVQGDGTDVDVQRRAGVGDADLFLALTREDNVNLMAAQVARLIFRVPRAIARVYEPSHRDVTDDEHVVTVCPTLYTVEALMQRVEEWATQTTARPERVVEIAPEKRAPRPRVDESKFILIVGAGKVGINLVRSLLGSGHEVALVERDLAYATQLRTELECPVIIGDGTLGPVLEGAGAARARVFVAVTGSDVDNLIACQLAKRVFHVPKTIARVSNPKNEPILRRLGVDATVSSTAIIEQVIERELPTVPIRTLLHLHGERVQIIEYVLGESCPVAGRMLREIAFPPDCNIVAIERAGTTLIPRGETRLEIGDMVIALVTREQEPQLRRLLMG